MPWKQVLAHELLQVNDSHHGATTQWQMYRYLLLGPSMVKNLKLKKSPTLTNSDAAVKSKKSDLGQLSSLA